MNPAIRLLLAPFAFAAVMIFEFGLSAGFPPTLAATALWILLTN